MARLREPPSLTLVRYAMTRYRLVAAWRNPGKGHGQRCYGMFHRWFGNRFLVGQGTGIYQ
jgi:hypothetical protein